MKMKTCFPLLVLALFIIEGCGGVTPIIVERSTIPVQKANLEMVLEENEGLEIVWEDAKDARDFYRGGVQKKAKAEKKLKEKAYPEAIRFYEASNDFLAQMLQYMNEDCAEYTLYEGTDILFFPNLLMADNYLKMGIIAREAGRERAATRNWKKAQDFANKSLLSEQTEWGLSLQQKILKLSGSRKN